MSHNPTKSELTSELEVTAPRRTRAWGPSRRQGAGGPSRRLHPITLVVVAVVAGLAIGRFVFFTDDPAPQAAPVAPTTVAEQIRTAEQRTEQFPQDPRAWQQLANLYLLQTAQTGDPALPQLAERALDRAEEAVPGEAATSVGRASLALTLHNFADAQTFAEEALERQPGQTEALAALVDANVELGDYDAAAATLQELLDVRPGAASLSRASYLRELNGDLDGAKLAMSQARTAAVGSPFSQATITTLLGDLQMNTGDAGGAREAYEQALALSPGNARAELGLARVDAASGDVAAATSRLDALVSRAPLPEAAILLTDLQKFDGNTEAAQDAAALVRAMTDLQQASGQIVDLEMALFEADHGDPGTAVELATQAYASRQTVFTADALAWALVRNGQPDLARPYVDELLRLGSRDASMRYHAAVVLAANGDNEAAALHLTQAFEMTPWFTFGQRDEAARLAGELDVPPPEEWSQ